MSIITTMIEAAKEKGDTFDIDLPDGSVLTFRRISDAAEWYRLGKESKEFYGHCKSGLVPPEVLPVRPGDETVCRQAYVLHRTAIEPEVSLAESLSLAKYAGAVFMEIVNQLEVSDMVTLLKKEEAEVERLGESLEETEPTETT